MLRNTLLVLLAGVGLSLTGCGQKEPEPQAGSKKYVIAVIPKGVTHEFWKSIGRGARRAAADLSEQGISVQILFEGPRKESDLQEQIGIVQQMATSRGIFELTYFFTSAIAAAHGGEAHSAEAVRHRIKQLIDAESAADVLSDDTIVEKLRQAGIDIARRTVAKYREAMRIPSSVQRRREKQVAATP